MRSYLCSSVMGAVAVSAFVLAAASPKELSLADKELFLKVATIESKRVLESGITQSLRAKMTDGETTHDAHIQFVEIFKPIFRGKEGTVEKNFRDSYKFNIAAYRIAKLLGLENMVPPSVEREVDGKLASVTWWVDDVKMTEAERRDQKVKPPATQSWSDQLDKVRVFDQLIHNMDRNQGNLLITNDWKVWMIDHTRAFRAHRTLLKPDALGRCDKSLLENLRRLNEAQIVKETGAYLRREEILGLLARRDVIVKFFDTEISTKGADAVLTGMPRSTPHASVP